MENEIKQLPTLRLSIDDLPEIKDWEVGRKYKLVIEVKQVAKNEHEMKDHTQMDAIFEITKIKELYKQPKEISKDDLRMAIDMDKLDYIR